MVINLFVAFILMLLTIIAGYIAWYNLWGSYRKKKRLLDAKTDKKETYSPKMDRKSYCYPTINDVMGYEFVSVVRVPDELTTGKHAGKDEISSTGTPTRPAGLEGISGEERHDEDEPNLPDERGQKSPLQAERKGKGETEDEYDVVESDVKIDPYELEQLNKMNEPWANRDYDDEFTEQMMDVILENNKDLIDNEGALDADSLRIAKEQEVLRSISVMEDFMENTDTSEAARSLMEDIENNKEGIDANDIPEV